MSSRRLFKLLFSFLFGLFFVGWLSSCGTQNLLPNQPLASVDPLPLPKLPDWIVQISPTAEATPLSQVRIRFKDPLIPVESLDSDEQKKLELFEMTPALPGRFRFLTPRMVGFQMDQALPKATRVRVTLKAGLSDLNNHRLDQDLAWTFNTEPIKLTNLPGKTLENQDGEVEPIDIQGAIAITSNTELDLASLKEHARLVQPGQQQGIGFQVALKEEATPTPEEMPENPQEQFDPSQKTWIYNLTPDRTLSKDTTFKLEFTPGLRPAKGNLPTEMPFTSDVKTYAPLAFEKIEYAGKPDGGGAYGRFVQGNAQLKFNNPLSAESAATAIQITPAAKEAPQLVRAYEGDRTIALNPWSLEPGTTYTLTISPDLKDKFGQTLGKPVTVQYSTGDAAADFWAPSSLHIFPASTDLQLNLSAVNLPNPTYQAAYKAVQPTDLVYVDSAYPSGEGKDLLPDAASWQSFPIPPAEKNKTVEIPVPLKERLGGNTGLLAYGVQARTYEFEQEGKTEWREPSFYGLVQLTNLGVFSQWFPESGLVRINHLDDGRPVGGAAVEVYKSQLEAKSRPTPRPCATGTTDGTGTLVLTTDQLRGCFQEGGNSFTDAPNLLTIVREGQDWAFARSLEWSGGYGYGVDAGWNSTKAESRGAIFSDRQLYQPGESAWFTGVAAYLKNGQLQQDKNVAYTVTLRNPDGKETNLGTQNTNEFGTFSLEVPIARNQPLGYYAISAKGSSGAEITGEFRVAEFKPPNFKVDLTVDKQYARMGDTLTAQAQSNYLFGPPVQGGKVDYYVTRQRAFLNPKGWEQFSFGRQWYYPEEEPSVPTDVLQQSAALDDQGKGTQSVKIGDDLPFPMTYRIDAQVTDVSNLSVSRSQMVTALVSDRLIGLNTDFVATAKEPFNVEVIVTDAEGKPQSGQSVKLELQRMIYSSVTRVIEGSRTAKDQIEYKTVQQTEIRSGDAPQNASFTAPESGSYRIRANFSNARNEVTATDTQIWVTGADVVGWGDRYNNERLDVKLDKETYQVGETATALIQSPYPEAELYFAVVKHGTIYKTLTPVQGGAPKVQFRVTPEMLPNAAVEAVLVRRGAPIRQVDPSNPKDLVRIGFAPFNLNLNAQYLKAKVTPVQTSLQPGAEQTLQLEVTNTADRPVQGQFTVMVVNEAVRQLTDYSPPDLVKTVYAEQPISIRFKDNRPDVVLQPMSSPLDKGWGYGGGESTGAGDTRIRTEFKPLAYYNGSVKTDANGRATVSFKLPDDLTTWRVMVVATDTAMHFGNAEATFISTKPLVTNPILPQFARPGDRLSAGLSVTNTTGQSGTLSINGTVSGSLKSEASTSLQTQVASGTNAYRFPLVAETPGAGEMQFTTQLNGNTDAFKVPLLVEPLEITEQVIETGSTTNQAQIPIKVDNTVANDAGGLEITLASTLIPELKEPARQVLQENQLPFLETTASQLAIASNLQILSRQYGQTFGPYNPQQQANSALERLQNLQRPDGGFAAYPGQPQSDPLVSPYAAESVAIAQRANLPVNAALVANLKNYLEKILADPGQYDYCKQQPCKDRVRLEALSALSALGTPRNSFLGELYERRAQFDPVGQIKLTRLLSAFPEWQSQANALAAELQETIYQTGRTASVSLPQNWGWLNSPSAAQSEALRLFIDRNAPSGDLDKLAQALLNQRQQGTWGSTYDNAQALTALVEYAQLQPAPPNFTATAQLGGKAIANAQFTGYQKTSESTAIPMAQLPRGNQTLTLKKSGTGTLHYLMAYRYRLQGNPPGRFNGVRVTRMIHPANKSEVLNRMGLVGVTAPFEVQPGQVFDVEVEIVVDHPVNHLVVTDPLPAGFEAVDANFQTSTPYFQAKSDSWQIGYQTIHRDRVVAYGDRLEAGVYSLHYLVRSVTPGTYVYPGAEAHLQYAPEEFGRSASATLKVAG